MPSNKKLGIELQASVVIDPAEVAIKTRGLNSQIEKQFKEAIKGLNVTAGGRFKVSPEVEKLSSSEFSKFKRAYASETDRLYKEAEQIDKARREAYDKYLAGEGKKPSAESLRLQQAKELAAQARKSSLALIEADREINRATRKRIAAGEKLSKREETLAARRYEATKNALRDLQQLGKLQKDQRVFDPATDGYAFLKGSNIRGLQRSIKILSDEASAYGKVVSQVNKTKIDSAAAAKAERELAAAADKASKARKAGLTSLRQYSAELKKLKSYVGVTPESIKSQAARSESIAKAAASQRAKVDSTIGSNSDKLQEENLKRLIRLRERLNSLEAAAKENAKSLNSLYEARNVASAQAKARSREEARLNSQREASLKKAAALEERIQKARRNSLSELRKDQAILRSLSRSDIETAGQARSFAGQAYNVADRARKQYNYLKSLRDSVASSGVDVDRRQVEKLNLALSRTRRLYKEAAASASKYKRAAEDLNVTLGQGSLLVRQFFRYALGYGALYQALGAINALKQSVVELDNSLYSIQAITDATEKSMVKVSGAIKRVALETKYTTKEVAEAARVLSQAGVQAEDLPGTLEAVSKFAAGTETEIKTAADLVSTMRNVFVELDDLDIANQLTKAINISKLTGEDLRTILGISAQVARQYNLTSQNYLAAVTTLRNAGLKASTTATGLRQGLNELFSPDNKTVKALQQRYAEIGEKLTSKQVRDKFFSFTGELNPLLAAVRELNRLGFTGAGRKSLARGFDIRAANALTALVNNIDQLEASQTKLASGNQVFKASETQMESLSASVDNLSAAFTVLATNVADGPIRSLEDFIDKITETVKWITELDTRAKSLGESGAISVAGTAVSGGILGSLLGKTPAKKAIGALLGAAGGTYVGTQQLETRAAGESSVISPETLNTLAGVITFFSLFRGESVLGKVFGKKDDAEKLAKAAEKNLGVIGRFFSIISGQSFKSIGLFLLKAAKSLTLVGLATTAVMFVIDKLLSDENDEAKKREEHLKRVKALRDKAETARQKVEKIEKVSNKYEKPNVSDYSNATIPSPDTVGGELQRNADSLLTYSQVFESVFGKNSSDQIKAIEKALINYRDTGFSKGTAEYKAAIERLSAVGGVGEISGELESQVNFLANNLKQLRNSVEANVKAVSSEVQQALDRVRSGSATDRDRALIQVVESGDKDIQLALDAASGQYVEDTRALLISLQTFWDNFAKANREVSGYVEAKLEAEKAAIDAFISEALLDIQSTDNTQSLRIKANSLVSSIEGVGESGIAYIDKLIEQTEVLKRRLELEANRLSRASKSRKNQHGRRISATATPEQAAAATANAGQVDVYLQQLRSKREKAVSDLQLKNDRTVEQVSSNLEELTKLSEAQIKSATGNDKALYDLVIALKSDETARKSLVTPVVGEGGRTLPAPGFNSVNGVLAPNQVVSELLAVVKRATADKGKSPDEQVGKLSKSPYIQDPATYRKLYELDRQIADAKKRNLKLLVDDNESNPLREKRDILLGIKDDEIAVEKAYLRKLENAYGKDPSDDKHRVELEKARASIQKKLVERDRVAADYQLQREEQVRKYQDLILSSAKKRLELEESLLRKELDSAISSGNSEAALRLTGKLYDIKQQLLDIDITNLQLSEQDSELTKATAEINNAILEAKRRQAEVASEVAALESEYRKKLLRSRGGVSGQAETAFLKASGSGMTVTDSLKQSRDELKITLANNLQQLGLAREAYSSAKASGADNTELSSLYKNIEDLSQSTGEYAGRLYLLNKQLDNDALSFENFREAWQSSTDDMASSLKSSVAVWYSESPKTIRTFLESIGDGIEAGLYSVFNKFTDTAITQLVQTGMDKVLGLFDLAYDKKMEVTANDVYVSANNAGGGRTTTGLLSGEVKSTTETVDYASGSGDSSGFSVTDKASTSAQQDGATESQSTAASGLGAGIAQPDDKAVEVSKENTDAVAINTVANYALSGDVKGLTRQILSSIVTSKVSDAQKSTQSIGLIQAITANTVAVNSNTIALQTSGLAPGFANGGVLKAAKGGILKGPGTGTSDSLRGYVVDSNGVRNPIQTSAGEAILTKAAVDFLGEEFVYAVNRIKPGKFASGGFPSEPATTAASKIASTVLSVPPPEVRADSKIVNLLDPSALADAMQSDEGTRVILNVIQSNPESVTSSLK